MSDHPNLAAALVAALADLAVVNAGRTAKIPGKDGKSGYSYDYAALEDVVKDTRPVLAEHGVVALTPLHDHGNGLACSVVLLHVSGERMYLGPFPFPAGRDAQATGSMVTYHRRYALLAALGMAAGDDDDGAAAQPRQEPAAPVDGPITAANAQKLIEKCDEAGIDPARVVDRGTNGRTDDPGLVLRSESKAVKQALEDLIAEAAGAGESAA